MTLINPTKVAISYHGHGPSSPLYKRQILVDADWVDTRARFCGNGVRTIVVPPGRSIQIALQAKETTVRYGIRYWPQEGAKEERVAWSDAIEAVQAKDPATKEAL